MYFINNHEIKNKFRFRGFLLQKPLYVHICYILE